MRIDTRMFGALLVASTLGAQGTANCITRPNSNTKIVNNGQLVGDTVDFKAATGMGFLAKGGEQFGITGYRCPACEMRRVPGHRPEYSFLTEPVVASVGRPTLVQLGDVIEAVNGQPITSSAGSTEWSYPSGGPTTLTVRRGRERMVLNFTVAPPCPDSATHITIHGWVRDGKFVTGDSAIRLRSAEAEAIRARSGNALGPIYVIDGVRYEPSASAPATHFGFGLVCAGDCGQLTIPDGTTYFRYSVPPHVSEIRDASLAATSGLKLGDVIVKVEGHSILEDEGALALARAEKKDSVRLTVLRDGKEVDVVLQASVKPPFGITRRP